jgi:hypothetical protein
VKRLEDLGAEARSEKRKRPFRSDKRWNLSKKCIRKNRSGLYSWPVFYLLIHHSLKTINKMTTTKANHGNQSGTYSHPNKITPLSLTETAIKKETAGRVSYQPFIGSS